MREVVRIALSQCDYRQYPNLTRRFQWGNHENAKNPQEVRVRRLRDYWIEFAGAGERSNLLVLAIEFAGASDRVCCYVAPNLGQDDDFGMTTADGNTKDRLHVDSAYSSD